MRCKYEQGRFYSYQESQTSEGLHSNKLEVERPRRPFIGLKTPNGLCMCSCVDIFHKPTKINSSKALEWMDFVIFKAQSLHG